MQDSLLRFEGARETLLVLRQAGVLSESQFEDFEKLMQGRLVPEQNTKKSEVEGVLQEDLWARTPSRPLVRPPATGYKKALSRPTTACPRPGDEKGDVWLRIVDAESVPGADSYHIKVNYGYKANPRKAENDPYVTKTQKGKRPVWEEVFKIYNVKKKDKILFRLYAAKSCIGETELTIGQLIERPQMTLLLGDRETGSPTTDTKRKCPTRINVKIHDTKDFHPLWGLPRESIHNPNDYPKHVMIVTRGTRGDVQPFVALGRGLAEMRGWMVTIVTELPYRDFIKSYSKVTKGCIRFRPSGGDTTRKIDKPLAKWAMQNKSEIMQAAMLARSEVEFFDSGIS
eukprot:TRINITY_DN7584_c0_g2_i3.p1 TRINITY_DN7584_c0_g2~~TRINITY_DN7584_c0_g2_i3.p1  ORF type:complete len:342 (+),score=49.38 TRINITY_DN7584_c0_g2_i3:368-1393(+)